MEPLRVLMIVSVLAWAMLSIQAAPSRSLSDDTDVNPTKGSHDSNRVDVDTEERFYRTYENGTIEFKTALSNGHIQYQRISNKVVNGRTVQVYEGYVSERYADGTYGTSYYIADENGYRRTPVQIESHPPVLPQAKETPSDAPRSIDGAEPAAEPVTEVGKDQKRHSVYDPEPPAVETNEVIAHKEEPAVVYGVHETTAAPSTTEEIVSSVSEREEPLEETSEGAVNAPTEIPVHEVPTETVNDSGLSEDSLGKTLIQEEGEEPASEDSSKASELPIVTEPEEDVATEQDAHRTDMPTEEEPAVDAVTEQDANPTEMSTEEEPAVEAVTEQDANSTEMSTEEEPAVEAVTEDGASATEVPTESEPTMEAVTEHDSNPTEMSTESSPAVEVGTEQDAHPTELPTEEAIKDQEDAQHTEMPSEVVDPIVEDDATSTDLPTETESSTEHNSSSTDDDEQHMDVTTDMPMHEDEARLLTDTDEDNEVNTDMPLVEDKDETVTENPSTEEPATATEEIVSQTELPAWLKDDITEQPIWSNIEKQLGTSPEDASSSEKAAEYPTEEENITQTPEMPLEPSTEQVPTPGEESLIPEVNAAVNQTKVDEMHHDDLVEGSGTNKAELDLHNLSEEDHEHKTEEPISSVDEHSQSSSSDDKPKQRSLDTDEISSSEDDDAKHEEPASTVSEDDDDKQEQPAVAVSDDDQSKEEQPAVAVSDDDQSKEDQPAVAVSDDDQSKEEQPAVTVSDDHQSKEEQPASTVSEDDDDKHEQSTQEVSDEDHDSDEDLRTEQTRHTSSEEEPELGIFHEHTNPSFEEELQEVH